MRPQRRPRSRALSLCIFGSLIVASVAATPASPAPLRQAAPTYKQDAGPFRVEVRLLDWTDAERGRSVPVKIYIPADAKAPAPLIVLSHGLGGSRDGYEYLGRHWAGHGYISLHIQHIGSDDAVWRGKGRPMQAMKQAAADPMNAVERARDVGFVIDEMEKLNAGPGDLAGRVDLERIGIAGHSFGANTTLVALGQLFVLPGGSVIGFADPRIKAAIPMSAPVPRDKSTLDRAFGKIAVPCLHMTGTLDASPIGETGAADRRLPFDHIPGPGQYLVIFEGGDHMIFSGRARAAAAAGQGRKDALFQDLIRQSSIAFWDAYLRGDGAAKKWLAGGGFEAVLGADGTFEKKIS